MALRDLIRVVDGKPWAAHLYVTDRCNLDCHYCNEYDNSRPHSATDDLKAWMGKIRELGTLRLGFQGGEPLMHPDIVELVRYAKHDLGFRQVSMSTNAFLLGRDHVDALASAGLDSLQISVDRMTPTESTRKSLEVVADKLDWFAGSSIRLQVAGVLFDDTVEEMQQVVDACVARGVPVHARVVHEDAVHGQGVTIGARRRKYLDFLDMEARRKIGGEPIQTNWNILAYQRAMLRGESFDWTCTGGYKYFFVSAQGQFWVCSQVRTDTHILDVTPELLRSYNRPKPCQDGCGVYCVVGMSVSVTTPVAYVGRELAGRLRTGWHAWRCRSGGELGRREATTEGDG